MIAEGGNNLKNAYKTSRAKVRIAVDNTALFDLINFNG